MKIRKYDSQPDKSMILNNINGSIHYVDSFEIEILNKKDFSVDYLTTLLFASVPGWVRVLSDIRDFMVRPFGLETGLIPEQTSLDNSIYYNRGDRAVFFLVIERSDSEIVMGEDDKHLYFRTSLFIQKNPDSAYQSLFLTTIVQFHNTWGRIYFVPVKPFHKLIMKTLLINFFKALKENES